METWVSFIDKIICCYTRITLLEDSTQTIISLELIKTIFNKQITFYRLAGVVEWICSHTSRRT